MAESQSDETIKVGQYVIIQRQEYTKLHKFNSLTSTASLGKDQVQLANIADCRYFTTFRMVRKGKGRDRLCSLEVTDTCTPSFKDNLNIAESGVDNRNIIDDGRSQKLSTEEIEALRGAALSSTDIVGTLVSNSNTFHAKTEYSQEKYLKKKQKKYYEYLQIRKPSIRLIADIMYRQDPSKIMGVRLDSLSQILAYSNISGYGNHMLYDSGSGGLISAAILNSIGPNTEGTLVHMHPGNTAQKQAILAMNFEDEQYNRCINVNLYSVLRHYYKSGANNVADAKINEDVACAKRKHEDNDDNDGSDAKLQKIDENNTIESDAVIEKVDTVDAGFAINDDQHKRKWEIENERACVALRSKVDSLVIVAKEHPLNIFKSLLPFVGPSRPFVIYCSYQEPLAECYLAMRKISNVVGARLTQSWMRGYQVLPDRTHPDVMMQSNSGFLLTGWILDSSPWKN